MRDAARNVPGWDGRHETATVRRTNYVRMSSAGVSADAPPGGTTGMRHDREPPPRGAPRLAAHGERTAAVGRTEPVVRPALRVHPGPCEEPKATPMTNDTRGHRPRNGWWNRLLNRIDDHVSETVDADARSRGWTVTVVPGTRTHEYRDPRWDRRRLCDECAGSGLDGARPCAFCADGVITDQLLPHTGDAS
jgi:hypothetical protein